MSTSFVRSSLVLSLALAGAGCGLVKVHRAGGDTPSYCAAARPVETSNRTERMQAVAAATRERFVAAATAFGDSDNDGPFEVAVGQPLMVNRCVDGSVTAYTVLGRVVRMGLDDAATRLDPAPARWNVDAEPSTPPDGVEPILANASPAMIDEAGARAIVAEHHRCLEVKLGACLSAKQQVAAGPVVADQAAAETSACSAAEDQAYARCFAGKQAAFTAALAELRRLQGLANDAQKDAVRGRLR